MTAIHAFDNRHATSVAYFLERRVT